MRIAQDTAFGEQIEVPFHKVITNNDQRSQMAHEQNMISSTQSARLSFPLQPTNQNLDESMIQAVPSKRSVSRFTVWKKQLNFSVETSLNIFATSINIIFQSDHPFSEYRIHSLPIDSSHNFLDSG
jgi:hypothetical protein